MVFLLSISNFTLEKYVHLRYISTKDFITKERKKSISIKRTLSKKLML